MDIIHIFIYNVKGYHWQAEKLLTKLFICIKN